MSYQELLESNQTGSNEGERKKSVEDRDDLVFELIKRRWDSISQHTSTLDTKAASLIGFVSIVVGLLVGGGTFEVSEIASSYFLYIPYFASIAFLLSSIIFGLKAFKEKRNFAIVVPDIRVLLEKYTKPNISYSEVLRKTAGTMVYYAGFAERGNEQKADDINKSWHLLLIGLGSVLMLLVLFTFEENISRFVETLEVIYKFGGMKLPYV